MVGCDRSTLFSLCHFQAIHRSVLLKHRPYFYPFALPLRIRRKGQKNEVKDSL
nr:MAG TPA: hypothetical protein [Caudoviricetes sp.]